MSLALAPPAVRNDVTPATVLFVSSRLDQRRDVEAGLSNMGLGVTSVDGLGPALGALASHTFAVCLVDLADGDDALPAIRALVSHEPDLTVVGLIDPVRPIAAAEALFAGATDLLSWPAEERDVATLVANARDREGMRLEARPASPDGLELFASSVAMRPVVEAVRAAAAGAGSVVVFGEPGAGRGMVCRSIHRLSSRSLLPFVVVDCTGSTPDDLEERLFGTTPDRRQSGPGRRSAERITTRAAIYQARGGTLVLGSLLDAPDRLQAKLARVIRDCEVTLNEKRARIPLDIRFMATVDVAPELAVRDDRIRHDLAERLSQTKIEMPPLRDRREDIPMLAVHMLREIDRAAARAPQCFTRSALALLSALPWPGNGREVRSVLETVVATVRRPVIELEDLFEHIRLDGVRARLDGAGTLRDARARFERDWISAVLVKHHGRVSEAARALGIQRTNLYRKVRQLNVARTLLASRR
jgi:DNA-binding NtrC family response regulator